MLIIISPAKTMDFETKPTTREYSQPSMLAQSEKLIDVMTTKSPRSVRKLMNISEALAEQNVQRYHNWSTPFKPSNAKQAVLAFKGDVYIGLEADKLTPKQLSYAQDHLRILSGLYGVLRPLDLIQPYRLEMGIKLKNSKGKNLYEFWGNSITDQINSQLQAVDSKILLNLSSNEYFKAIKNKEITADIVTPKFKDWSNGQYKMISFFAKKARGSMSRWVIKNKVKSVNKLLKFDQDGYQYSEEESDPLNPVFLRKQ